ncbi:MAG: hypothetical protein IJL94_02190, partial [Erysipelotrichaceae bacterium]|nr:hypothetical protein [Erysipelotrichaceae bacterium]
QNAIVSGGVAGVLCLAICLILFKVFGFYLPYIYLGAGYLIGLAIQKFGKDVQPKFSVLALGICACVVLIADMIYFGSPEAYFSVLTSFGTTSLIEVACRIGACYLAYMYARAVM